MNCAVVNITRAQARVAPLEEREVNSVEFFARPEFLVADVGNGCETPHTTAELKYPEPGPDLVEGDGAYPLVLPSGDC
jgi:hypothetical protein